MQTRSVKMELQLPPCSHEQISLTDAQAAAIRHDSLSDPRRCNGTAGGQSGQFSIDLTQRKAGRKQSHQMPSHHKLLKIKPLNRSRAFDRHQQAVA